MLPVSRHELLLMYAVHIAGCHFKTANQKRVTNELARRYIHGHLLVRVWVSDSDAFTGRHEIGHSDFEIWACDVNDWSGETWQSKYIRDASRTSELPASRRVVAVYAHHDSAIRRW